MPLLSMETIRSIGTSSSQYSEARTVASSFVQFPDDFHPGITRRYKSELSLFLTGSKDGVESNSSKHKDWSMFLNAYTVKKLAEISEL
jgi:hypothetical protein